MITERREPNGGRRKREMAPGDGTETGGVLAAPGAKVLPQGFPLDSDLCLRKNLSEQP